MRLFVAVPLDDVTRETATRVSDRLRVRLGSHAHDFSWAKPDTFHLTLKFLGDVEPARLDDVSAAVREACAGVAPFDLIVGALGGFPRLEHPRVLWLGLDLGDEPLRRLAQRVDEALVLRNFPGETRPFTAHLTLARAKGRGHASVHLDTHQLPFAPTNVDRVVVYESHLRPGGSVHEPRAEVVLRG